VAITAPVPRPPHRFWRCCDRWMTLSRHPGSRPDLEPLWSDLIRVANCLFARRACRRVTADIRPDLDPRSLDPDRSFWSAFAELIWSQTSPTDFCNCYDERALCPSSHDPRWDDHLDGLPVLTPLRPLPCGSGEVRRAAHRPFDPTPVPVPPGCPGLPDRDIDSSAPPPRVAPRSYSGDRRARVRGPSEGRVDYLNVREFFTTSHAWCMHFEECMRT